MKQLAYLNKYFLRYKWKILAGIFFVICANGLNAFIPDIVQLAVDNTVDNITQIRSAATQTEELKTNLAKSIFYFFLLYLGVSLLAGMFTFFQRQMIIVVSRLIEFDLKNDIYDHYQKVDLAFYRSNNTGDLMSRITEDVSRVRMYAGPAIMYSVNFFFTILFITTRMFTKDAELALYALIPLPVLSVIIYYVNEKVEKASSQIQAKLSDMTTNAQETYSGIRVVQAYGRETEMIDFFKSETENYKQKQLNMAKIDAVYFPAMTFLIGCSIVIVVLVGGQAVNAGRLSLGAITAFLMYTNMLMWPVSSLGWVASMIQRAIVSQKRINEFLSYTPAVSDEKAIAQQMRGEIVFDKVSFTYPNTGIQALQNISFKIKPGERIAVIGKTGSGKTTIADLIMRMYDVNKGSILIDGYNVRDWELVSLRRQIGFVPQDVFLFSETITDNIAFGLEQTDAVEAKRFAHYASIGKEIESFAQGYDTMVGERGVTLSGGQKQRISIARALIKQPNVLILDDSLSAVDTTTEKEIQKNLEELLTGKTAIIITHRIFSLIHFDNILVLDNGTIAEQGTHAELLQHKGLYADIYHRQQAEQKEAQA